MDRNMPLISVIMPAFNSERSVSYAIESVLAQTQGDFELILVDDASTDGTREIMLSYAARDDRIEVLANRQNSRRHHVPWEPRNNGLEVARGRFIAYLDSDNLWGETFLSTLSGKLLANDAVQLVYCNSTNHYSSSEQYRAVLDLDKRTLVERNDERLMLTFATTALSGTPGIDWYIDTNEIMHQASIFERMGRRWLTRHPHRNAINQSQIIKRPYRRHNDQELVEAVMAHFGKDAVSHVDVALVEYYYRDYPGAAESGSPSRHDDDPHCGGGSPLTFGAKLSAGRSSSLAIEHFFENYLDTGHSSQPPKYLMGLGEIDCGASVHLKDSIRSYLCSGPFEESLKKYGGTTGLRAALSDIAAGYTKAGLNGLTEHSVTPFDGGHNALFHAMSITCSPFGSHTRSRNAAFMVPSYPYWNICAAAGIPMLPVEAYGFGTFIEQLERQGSRNIGAIIVNSPANPLNCEVSEEHILAFNRLASRFDAAIIVDMPYWTFGSGSDRLGVFDGERTIWCDSVSKSLGLPGLRLGFTICRDRNLAALVRTHKSASSLLPSAFKTALVHFLMLQRPDWTLEIARFVARQRAVADVTLARVRLPKGVNRLTECDAGLYDLFAVDANALPQEVTEGLLTRELRNKHGITSVSGAQMFPENFKRRNSDRLIRLSYGRVAQVGEALLEFEMYLSSVVDNRAR